MMDDGCRRERTGGEMLPSYIQSANAVEVARTLEDVLLSAFVGCLVDSS